MKRKLIMLKPAFLLIIFFLTLTTATYSQDPPPPPPGEHGGGGNVPGGGAPVGNGLAILIALGTAYGVKKIAEKDNKIND
jgi:hypothetical protein